MTRGIHCCNFRWPRPIWNANLKIIGIFRCQ